MPLVKCANCGLRIDRETAIKISIQNFCPQHPYPKNISTRKRGRPPTNGIRKLVGELDNSKCRFCGTMNNTHLHHVIYRSQGGPDDITNLITLCQKHHDEVHSDKSRFMPLCLGVIWLRNVYKDKMITIPRLEKMMEKSCK